MSSINQETPFKILHLSDFHFGNTSSEKDTTLPTDLADEINDIKKYIRKNDICPDLIILSGDFVNTGNTNDFGGQYFQEIIRPFNEIDIPILPCNGNHDFKREKVNQNPQFEDYTNFLKHFTREQEKIELSDNVDKNQSCFVDFPNQNLTFISMNTSLNMHWVETTRTIGGKKYKDKEFRTQATLPPSIYDPLFEELNYKIPFFAQRNKFAITHHPLQIIKNHVRSFKLLNEFQIRIVFSGDAHQYYFEKYDEIIESTCGSLLVSNKERWDPLNRVMSPQQFNTYSISSGKIKFYRHKRNIENSEWENDIQKIKSFPYSFLWTPESWCNYINSPCILKSVMADNIEYILKSNSNGDFVGFTFDNQEFRIYIVNETTLNVPQKFAMILHHITGLLRDDLPDFIRVVDNTGFAQSQMDEKYIWSE